MPVLNWKQLCSNMLLILLALQIWSTIINIITATEALVQLPPNVSIPAVIAFGDSIVDQGCNNNLKTIAKCNFPPYGKNLNPPKPTGRFSNGKTPPDLLAAEFGIKELLPAYLDPHLQSQDLLTGVSFASGGMGYDPLTTELASALSASDQIKMFKEYIEKLKGLVGEEKTSYILGNSIFIVFAGSNDLTNTYLNFGVRSLQYDVSSYADLVIAYASDFIQAIYDLGARRIIIPGVPPLGCLPSQRTIAGGPQRKCVDRYNQAAQLYNIKLSSKLHILSQNLPLSKIVYADIYNPLLNIIQNPHNYGIDIADKGCCGSGNIEVSVLCNKLSKTCSDSSKYLFWDSFHPTEKGYQIFVHQIISNYISRLV